MKDRSADLTLDQPLLAPLGWGAAEEIQSAAVSPKDTEHCRYHQHQHGNSNNNNNNNKNNKLRAPNLVAELQIETLSTAGTQIFLYSWYAMLILALVLQSFVTLQWKMTNICNAATENLNHLDQWNSSCVVKEIHWPSVDWDRYGGEKRRFPVPVDDLASRAQTDPMHLDHRSGGAPHTYDLRWVGTRHGGLLDVKLNRFAQIVLSMASPCDHFPDGVEEREYKLMVALEEIPFIIHNVTSDPSSSSSSSSSSYSSYSSYSYSYSSAGGGDGDTRSQMYVYNATTTCRRTAPRCSSVVLPQDVVVTNNESRLTLTIFDVDEELANVSEDSAVGIVFQNSQYTIGTIVWRYTFMSISIIQLIRFLFRKRFSRALYEQYWVMLLQVGLFLYLDPLFAAGIYEPRGAAFYHFFEFCVPNCFAALFVCFAFAVITASMNWGDVGMSDEGPKINKVPSFNIESPPVEPYGPDSGAISNLLTPLLNQLDNAATSGISRRTSDTFDGFVRHIHAPRRSGVPIWTKVVCAVFFLCVLGLVILQIVLGNADENTTMVCTGLICDYIRYTMYSLLLLGILVCCVLLFWLHQNLGHRPYLESRPQQLACRVFIFVFSTAFIYFVVQVILIVILYPQIIGIVLYQPFTQLSPVMVSTFFVNHITFVYTTTVASRRVPIRPDNPRWRRVVWSTEWHQWLDNHGGILYIFHSERQERYFNYLQNRERKTTKERQRRCTEQFTGSCALAITENMTHQEKMDDLNKIREDHIRSEIIETSESSDSGESSEVTEGGSPTDAGYATPPVESEGKLSVLQWAERQLIDRPAALIDRLEDALIDPLQSLFLRGRGRMQFFNLETAIDCLNLSWEAYAVTESCGDVDDTTDMDMNPRGFPLAAISAIRRVLCCFSESTRATCESDIDSEKKGGAYAPAGSLPDTDTASGVGGVPVPKMDTEQYGYRRIAVFEARAVQVIVAVMDTSCPCHHRKLPRLVIAFRGTDNLSNAREDIRFRKRIWREIDNQHLWNIGQRAKVHTGFLDIWVTLKQQVLGTIRTHLEKNKHIVYSLFFTGHSLGGALATLCAYSVKRMLRLMQYPVPEVTVYTFGQPPLGNRAFQTAYNKAIPRHFRVVNESDAVSLFRLFGGCHVGIEVDIDRHGNYICMPMFIERLFRPTQGRGFAVVNHTLAAYAQSLNAVAKCNAGNSCKVRCLQPYLLQGEIRTNPQSSV